MTMKISKVGDVFHLAGVIDENADFSALLNEPEPLSLNWSAVERINSVGVRNWMFFMTKWGEKPLRFLECPTIITDQIAMIPSFLGVRKRVGVVVSADVVFECPKCQFEKEIRVQRDQVAQVRDGGAQAPQCPHCAVAMRPFEEDHLQIFS